MNERKRAAKILQAVTERTLAFEPADGAGSLAPLSVRELARQAGVAPNNTSTELNLLYRAGLLVKVSGRPAFYLSRAHLETTLGRSVPAPSFTLEEFLRLLGQSMPFQTGELPTASSEKTTEVVTDIALNPASGVQDNPIEPAEKPGHSTPRLILSANSAFDLLIGARQSLAPLIKRAKAAILYPPSGLHTLITGATGTGKSHFARCMYDFAQTCGAKPKHSAFITLNCANYADNPQLLLSQLFGYAKGAYTGADRDQSGLVERAHEGILFLDEIHRLSPEGQEKLFLLIDQGIFSRLGESKAPRKANVLIIGATTEEPGQNMLATFLRRIPMHIVLPPLEERSFEERMALIINFFWQEARNAGESLKVGADVIRALCFYNCEANIGQLASDIKLTCASAWYDYLCAKGGAVQVNLEHLAERVRQGLVMSTQRSENLLDDLLKSDELLIDNRQDFASAWASLTVSF